MERGPFWRAGLLPESPWEAHPVTIIANLGEPIGESRFSSFHARYYHHLSFFAGGAGGGGGLTEVGGFLGDTPPCTKVVRGSRFGGADVGFLAIVPYLIHRYQG